MISYIKGKVVKKGPDYIILDNGGMGYFISTSLSTLNRLREGENVLIWTYMHIREDVIALFGFLTSEEIEIFKKLISVSGVGPRVGLSVLSTYEASTVKEIILKDDVLRMSKVSGIGKKTAELKDKVGTLDGLSAENEINVSQYSSEVSDIINALIALGFNPNEAKKAIDRIDITGKTDNEIIKEALKKINR